MNKFFLLIIYILLSSQYLSANETFYEEGITFLKNKNINQAINSFKKSSENDNALAMYKLGVIYQEDNHTEAIKWYIKAKEAGNIRAKYKLGVLSCKMKTYTHLKDFEEYARIYSKQNIQYDLAVCFAKNKNKIKALKWFKKVANKNSAKAQYQVAKLSTTNKEKIKWLKKASIQEYHFAEFELGRIFFKQHKVKKAKKWLYRAKKHGSKRAIIYLKRIKALGL